MSESEDQAPVNELISEQQERQLLIGVILPDQGALTPAQRDKARKAAHKYVRDHNIGNATIGASIGFGSPTTWSQVLNGTYLGNVDKHLRALNKWVEEDARTRASRPQRTFIHTAVAKAMFNLARIARRDSTIAVAYGPTGIGKTECSEVIAEQMPGTIYERLGEESNSARYIRDRLIGRLRLERGKKGERSVYALKQRLFDALASSGRLIILDEAHSISDKGLEFVRELYDRTGCGVLLVCTKDLWKRIYRMRDDDHGQFYSRCSMSVNLTNLAKTSKGGRGQLFTRDDIRELYQSKHVKLTDDAILYLVDVANDFGGGSLRRCRDLVRDAGRIARNRMKGEPSYRAVTLDARLLNTWARQAMCEEYAAAEFEQRYRRVTTAAAG